jgi:hypothetical protein
VSHVQIVYSGVFSPVIVETSLGTSIGLSVVLFIRIQQGALARFKMSQRASHLKVSTQIAVRAAVLNDTTLPTPTKSGTGSISLANQMPSGPCDTRQARICDDFRSLGVPTTASQHSRLSSRRTAPKCHHDLVHHCSSVSRRCVPYQRLGHPLWLRLIYYRSHQDPPLSYRNARRMA